VQPKGQEAFSLPRRRANYEEGRRAFNLNAHQHPALVVMAAGAADVIAAVRFARELGLSVGVLATGHAVASPCDGGALINTSRMQGVRVDPDSGLRED
jgi:FAD/FMN-containing dehydrogenase